MEVSAPKCQRTTDETFSAAGMVSEELKVRQEDQVTVVFDTMEPAASPASGPLVVGAMRKGLEAMYPMCSFHNFDFRELVDEHKLTHGELFL